MAHSTQPLTESWTLLRIGASEELNPSGLGTEPLLEEGDIAALLRALNEEAGDEITDPRAEGACLFDMTPGEWRFVRNAPLAGFVVVAGADGLVLPDELRALSGALEQGKHASSELFRAVCRELCRHQEPLVELLATDTFEREQLSEAYRLAVEKLGQEEAERFKECVLDLGRQVARASGGVLSAWGWLRGPERRALTELAKALT